MESNLNPKNTGKSQSVGKENGVARHLYFILLKVLKRVKIEVLI